MPWTPGRDDDPAPSAKVLRATLVAQGILLDDAIDTLALTAARLCGEQRARAEIEARLSRMEETMAEMYEEIAHLNAGLEGVAHELLAARRRRGGA